MDMQYNVPLCPNHRVRPKPQKAREQLAALQVEYDDDGDERSRVRGRCARDREQGKFSPSLFTLMVESSEREDRLLKGLLNS